MNIVEHVSLLHAGESGYMPRSGIAGSSESEVPSFLRNRQTDFRSGCTSSGGVFLFLSVFVVIANISFPRHYVWLHTCLIELGDTVCAMLCVQSLILKKKNTIENFL